MLPSSYSRRDFMRTLGAGLGAAALAADVSLPLSAASAPPTRRLKIGHTGITWKDEDVAQCIRELGTLGYEGFETFGWVAQPWEETKGSLKPLLDAAKLPLIGEYCSIALHAPERRKAEIEKVMNWGRTIKKLGGHIAVIGPSSIVPGSSATTRAGFDFAKSKADIITTLNEVSKQLADIGITPALHPHTGTSIMTRDEIYAVMEAADTKVVKFCPDIGQIAKAGADPLKIVQDFLPLVRHAHVKDFDGGPHWEGYCPLGKGRVDIAGVMALLEKADMQVALVELDISAKDAPPAPMPPAATAAIAKDTLQKLGYKFRV